MLSKFFLALCGLLFTILALADNDIYSFTTLKQKQKFEKITQELRCLVCQNESLADSNAGLAKDLRAQIYLKIQENYSELEIKQYLVKRYGQFILFKPAVNSSTIMLWSFPFLILLLGFGVLSLIIQRRKKMHAIHLSPAEQQQVKNLMKY